MTMSLAVVYTRAQLGIIAPLVRIEVHVTAGLPSFTIVGLPEKAVKESRERVRSALVYNQFNLAIGRVTVNLAPADLPKMGAHYDLAIAIGLLAAQGDLELKSLQTYEFFGEMGLVGEEHRTANLVTRTPCEFGRISYQDFHAIRQQFPDVLYALTTQIGQRLKNTTRKLADLTFIDV